MLVGNEFVRNEGHLPKRNNKIVTKAKDGVSVTLLIPTLFEMSKALMKMRCNLEKADFDNEILEEFSKIESAMMKMTADIEYLRRKGS